VQKKGEDKMSKFLIIVSLLYSFSYATNIHKIACMENNASECYEYALPLVTDENATVQDIREEGLSYIRKSCVFGFDKACDILGENYYKDKSYIAARPYLEKSCNRGIKTACESMGVIYRDAHDVRHDDVKAREFFEKACVLKSPDACYNVAIIYRGGFGIAKSRIQEKAYYQKSCTHGLKAGCERFSELDNEDKGIKTGLFATLKSWFN
jgi:TPR repeat protein